MRRQNWTIEAKDKARANPPCLNGPISRRLKPRLINTVMTAVDPDMLVIHGDRPETLAGAVSGSMNLVLTAHVEGGELSGTIDELIRHAVTKLAHIHFVSNRRAQQRLIQMGELNASIHVIGSPDIDIMLSDRLPELSAVRNHYEIPFSRYVILVYHPVAFEVDGIDGKIRAILEGIRQSGRCCVAIYPNNEPGSERIIESYRDCGDEKWFRALPSMRFESFLTLLKHADAIIGNSSCGIHEAPVYGVPTINIGSRQKNRFRHASIRTVSEEPDAVAEVLHSLPRSSRIRSTFFGDGNSCRRFMEVLLSPGIWHTARDKQFRDLKGIHADETASDFG